MGSPFPFYIDWIDIMFKTGDKVMACPRHSRDSYHAGRIMSVGDHLIMVSFYELDDIGMACHVGDVHLFASHAVIRKAESDEQRRSDSEVD